LKNVSDGSEILILARDHLKYLIIYPTGGSTGGLRGGLTGGVRGGLTGGLETLK
jgi:hypothetical protein